MSEYKDYSIKIKAKEFDSTNILFEGIADDDEVYGGHVSRSGPGFELSFSIKNSDLEKLGEELIRAGNVLRVLGRFNK